MKLYKIFSIISFLLLFISIISLLIVSFIKNKFPDATKILLTVFIRSITFFTPFLILSIIFLIVQK